MAHLFFTLCDFGIFLPCLVFGITTAWFSVLLLLLLLSIMAAVMRVLTYLVAAVAILIGIFLSSIPSQLGLYRWLASKDPSLVSW